jgi:hypothetical protein
MYPLVNYKPPPKRADQAELRDGAREGAHGRKTESRPKRKKSLNSMRLPTSSSPITRSALMRLASTLAVLPAGLLPAEVLATEGNRADRGAGANYAYQPALEGKGYGKSEMDYSVRMSVLNVRLPTF